MKAEAEEIKQQAQFCSVLMDKLNENIHNSGGFKVNTIKADVKRLRRELSEITKMIT